MKSPKWVATTRQLIKSKYGFGWSISGWERNNKLITKVVYRYQDGSRNSILVDLIWTSENSGKMINLIEELADLMQERSVDLGKAYELINGGKISKGIKKEINWEALTDEFIYDERGNRRDTTKRDLMTRMYRTLQAVNAKPKPINGEQLFKNYAELFFDRTMPKGGVGRKRNMGDLIAYLEIPSSDIGFVKEGMDVEISIDSYPATDFGIIEGTITSNGTDALEPDPSEQRNQFVYPARIELKSQKLKLKRGKRLDLKVGMSLQGNIKLRKVSYLQLLFTNFKDKTKSIQEL